MAMKHHSVIKPFLVVTRYSERQNRMRIGIDIFLTYVPYQTGHAICTTCQVPGVAIEIWRRLSLPVMEAVAASVPVLTSNNHQLPTAWKA